MSLLDLPVELVENIVALTVTSRGFESAVLACKAPYEIGKPDLAEYNLRRKWKSVSLSRKAVRPISCLDILTAIAQKPIVATYLEELDLDEEVASHDNVQDERPSIEEARLISNLLVDSHILRFASQYNSSWLDGSRLGLRLRASLPSEPATTASHDSLWPTQMYRIIFLLTLLPNLRTLTLPVYWGILPHPSDANEDGTAWLKVLDTLGSAHAQTSISPPPMGRLTTLRHVEEISIDPAPRSYLDDVLPFMTLPSLTTLEANNLIAADDYESTDIPFSWRYSDRMSNLERIDFHGCCMDASGITELLEHTPQLKVLKYSHCFKYGGIGHNWEAGPFVEAIAKQRGDTLVELSVTIIDVGDIETEVRSTSMKDFKVLEKFEAALTIFWERDKSRMVDPDTWWPPESVDFRAAMLPPSLKVFEICSDGEDPRRQYTALERVFEIEDVTPGPNLERISVEIGGCGDDWQVGETEACEVFAAIRTSIKKWEAAARDAEKEYGLR